MEPCRWFWPFFQPASAQLVSLVTPYMAVVAALYTCCQVKKNILQLGVAEDP